MSEDILVRGIETNNLKSISISLKKNAINLIIGPSGSGKSSLAYDTIAQIGLHELGTMYADFLIEPRYKVDSYENMLVTVPVEQVNHNNNVRSTIGTYFSLNLCLSKIFSSVLSIPYDNFVLNKVENICPKCLGIGYSKVLDPNKIIDYDKTIEDVPFRCWNRSKDFYRQILICYCRENDIPTTIKFRELTQSQKNDLLNGCSDNKYTIKFKSANRFTTRTTKYFGPLNEKVMLKSFSPSSRFFSDKPCSQCNGEKFDISHRQHKVAGLSIGEVLTTPFCSLENWIDKVEKTYDCNHFAFSLNQLKLFIKKAIELKLGYLYLNRSIPSLSGGELQRLRLTQIFTNQLTGLLIILDEPLAGLDAEEQNIVYKNIKKLSGKHTLLIVDHHDKFIKDAARIISLGPGSGKNGGNIIDTKQYLKKEKINIHVPNYPCLSEKHLKILSNVYSYKGIDITICDQSMNIISGPSGIGKSTVLREYLPQILDNYDYISQKPLFGNVHSTVATELEIMNKLTNLFSKTTGKSRSLFSNMPSADGACRYCKGTGLIKYGTQSGDIMTFNCNNCNGTGFDKKVSKYYYHSKSLIDILRMTVDEAFDFFFKYDESIASILENAKKLLLGHLVLGEKTSQLSGGENVRIKILKCSFSDKNVLGIDEPFKGLNNCEINTISLFLYRLSLLGKTIIVVDHEEESFQYFAKHIVLENRAGILTGKNARLHH